MNVTEMFSLQGKVAVVTGGAGLYGRQIVEALAEAGGQVVMASRNLEALEAVAKEFRGRGLAVEARAVDQSDEGSIKRLRGEVLDAYGQVDVLINNAVLRSMKPETYDPAGWARSMAVNATGLYMITELFSEPMKERQSGSIVNVGSIQGMIGVDPTLYEGLEMSSLVPDYFFHKGGMINYTRYMASVLGMRKVRVNCISPGGFFSNQPEKFVERYNARTFLGRMANDQDLKGIIVFLASEASAYITGANIPVDGGYTAK
jgi:NAD(P)-dependent dehydrogenase (short-subunit alcohol dehydrogenase family)